MGKYFCKSNGFTLVELLTTMAVIGILATIGLVQYFNYIDNAKKMVSVNALSNMRKQLEHYSTDYGTYPAAIDFTNCKDPDGNLVLPAFICSQLIKEVYALDSYTGSQSGYTLIARAKDTARTVVTINQSGIYY